MNKKLFFIYRLLIVLSLLIGIVLNLINTTSIKKILSYYTMQSNILCLITFIIFIINDISGTEYKKSNTYFIIKGAITITILLTLSVYLMSLVPNNLPMYEKSGICLNKKKIANLFVHIISPILVIMDYFLFDEKGYFKLYYPIIWLFLPILYLQYVYIYNAIGGSFYNLGGSNEFGYFFLDYKKIGVINVVGWIISLSLFVLLISYLLIYIDKKRSKQKRYRKV